MATHKYVYFFSAKNAEGDASKKQLLGGKGANLAEMAKIGVPVPAGFTISTEVCSYYYDNNNEYPKSLQDEINKNLEILEQETGKKFGDSQKPLLVSVRSGAAVSMPGMMDTVLNLGLNDVTIKGIIEQSGNERFAYDSYRRFIQMFGNVVLGMKHESFEHELETLKEEVKVKLDTDLDTNNLKELVKRYKSKVKNIVGVDFPQDPQEQLQKAIDAVFSSWMNPRANTYRRLNSISDKIGTAVNVQSMVFGNMGETSGTGVAFTRNPANGEKAFYGEFLMNAQGEDVVAGIRTPLSIEKLNDIMPHVYKELLSIAQKLENHYTDMQDLEFTIENKKLYLLQTRSGKRTGFASIRIAMEMYDEKLIDEKTAIMRIDPNALPSLLANIFDPAEKKIATKENKIIAHGLAAGPGAASGKIVFTTEKAVELAAKGEKVILLTSETSPEDISGMNSSQGILTTRGGMTSHAAVVARGMNKPCIVGCTAMEIDLSKGKVRFVKSDTEFVILSEFDEISIDGFTGEIINKDLKTIDSEIEQVFVTEEIALKDSTIAQHYDKLMAWANKYKKLMVRANADTGPDAKIARKHGAMGIGLCRTEHMFFEEERIMTMRRMILAVNDKERQMAIDELLPYQKDDFIEIFREMNGLPVTIRLLDPPLHEFLPHDEELIADMAFELNKSEVRIKNKIEDLKEFNPMLGHRGCRLAISFPEIPKMQVRAIMEAACELQKEGIEVFPEIMVPLVGHYKELEIQKDLIREVAELVMREKGITVKYSLGTMIEVPRAALTADKIAKHAEFFSFGTNDLTQLGAGFSRDDAGSFLPKYEELGIYDSNPFQVLDRDGIGELIKIAIDKGHQTNPNIKLGVCGEHGGDPQSVEFCHKIGLSYVSCSPYRIPVAILAAAQAAIREG